MPQIIVRYDPVHISENYLRRLSTHCCHLVAVAASTPKAEFTSEDVEWILSPYGPGSVAPAVAVEIRTIGLPERKAKLTRERLKQLKSDFLAAGFAQYFPQHCSEDKLLIWMQFIDPDGAHV